MNMEWLPVSLHIRSVRIILNHSKWTRGGAGLAFLHLDGKLDSTSADEVADRVRAAVSAIAAPQIG
jgi:hypothetical protein